MPEVLAGQGKERALAQFLLGAIDFARERFRGEFLKRAFTQSAYQRRMHEKIRSVDINASVQCA